MEDVAMVKRILHGYKSVDFYEENIDLVAPTAEISVNLEVASLANKRCVSFIRTNDGYFKVIVDCSLSIAFFKRIRDFKSATTSLPKKTRNNQ